MANVLARSGALFSSCRSAHVHRAVSVAASRTGTNHSTRSIWMGLLRSRVDLPLGRSWVVERQLKTSTVSTYQSSMPHSPGTSPEIGRRESNQPSVDTPTTSSSLQPSEPPSTSTTSAVASSVIDPSISKVSSQKQQTLTDWSIVKRLAVNIWPKGDNEVKIRVVAALTLLVAGKVSAQAKNVVKWRLKFKMW